MTENQRVKLIRKHLGLTQIEMAYKLGVKQNTVSAFEKDGNTVTSNIKTLLSSLFNANIKWIEDGSGEMFDASSIGTASEPRAEYGHTPRLNTDKRGVPYYDVDFIAGFEDAINNQTLIPTYYIDFLPFNDADCWLNVTGKSMGPLIAHGDIVALKEVQDWKTFLLEGEIYAIVTTNGFRTIKILGKDVENDDNYLLIPYNKSGDYHPQPIPKTVINKVFRVKGAIKKFF